MAASETATVQSICRQYLPVFDTVAYKTSTPNVRTGVYPHMPIAVTASGGQWPVCHTGLATARPFCRTWLTSVQCIIDFSVFGLGGLTPGPKFTKRGEDLVAPRSTILQNFIALRQPTPEISVTKILRTKKRTNSKRHIPSMPIGMWG